MARWLGSLSQAPAQAGQLAPSLPVHAAPALLHHEMLQVGLHLSLRLFAPVARASDALHCKRHGVRLPFSFGPSPHAGSYYDLC